MSSVLTELQGDESYRLDFELAFGDREITEERLAGAIAAFERSLVAANSRYDHYHVLGDEEAMSEAAIRGLRLFRGKARCNFCHEGDRFTDERFHNTGVSWGKKPIDLGRHEYTGREEDKGRFKTPSLRDVVRTPPYMHDGSFKTLNEVLDFYDRGGGQNPYQDAMVKRLHLSEQAKLDLIEFLKCLTSATVPSGLADLN